jgi:hypothetical protein
MISYVINDAYVWFFKEGVEEPDAGILFIDACFFIENILPFIPGISERAWHNQGTMAPAQTFFSPSTLERLSYD